MSTRSAEATIKGYYYQFDTSILSLLKLPKDTDSIVIEGIEDIDVKTATEETAIQCKYLSKPKFINSAVREPIILMLNHFVDPSTSNDLKYVLYAHFENEIIGNEPTLDLAKIKDILTYSEGPKGSKAEKHYEVENGISDAQLLIFLSQFTLTFGTEFSTQQKQVNQLFKNTFACSDFEADVYFYNNALRVILDIAIKKNVGDRKITKSQFIKEIDCRKKLFNEWFLFLRTKKDYLKMAAQNLKSTKALLASRAKIIILGHDIISADNSEFPLISFIENLIAKYFKPGSALSNAKPLTLVLDCDSGTLRKLKAELIDSEIHFNDGYEEIKFSSKTFNAEPIKNTIKGGTKISKSSYSIKIVAQSTLLKDISSIHHPGVLINFSKTDAPIKFSTGQFFDFKYCADLKDAYYLLEP